MKTVFLVQKVPGPDVTGYRCLDPLWVPYVVPEAELTPEKTTDVLSLDMYLRGLRC